MAITVKSPYSGRLVKVRDQDVGRAIRDEAGRIFYVVPRSEGEGGEGGGGYYAARTRRGSAKEERAYLEIEEQPALAAAVEEETVEAETVHDATGRRRSMRPRLILGLVVIVVLLGVLWYSWYVRGVWFWWIRPAAPQRVEPTTTRPPPWLIFDGGGKAGAGVGVAGGLQFEARGSKLGVWPFTA